MSVCAIHQPNFFPWMPYFDKMRQADVFVILDGVDYPKSGSSMQSWCNRVAVDMHGKDTWFMCPVKRESGPQAINEVKINYEQDFRSAWDKLFVHAYKKAPNYTEVSGMIYDLVAQNFENLAEFNLAAIKHIAELLGLKTKIVRHTDLGLKDTGNQLLIDLCKAVECNTYLSGTGAQDYMDLDAYKNAGIDVIYQDYAGKVGRDKKLSVAHHLFQTPKEQWGAF